MFPIGGSLFQNKALGSMNAPTGPTANIAAALGGGGRSVSDSVIESGLAKFQELTGSSVTTRELALAVNSLTSTPSAREIAAQTENLSLRDIAQSEEMRLKQLVERQNQELAVIDNEITAYSEFLDLVQQAPLQTPEQIDKLRTVYQKLVQIDPNFFNPDFINRVATGQLSPQDQQQLQVVQNTLNQLKEERARIDKEYTVETLEAAMRREEALRALERTRAELKRQSAELMKKFKEQTNGETYEAQQAAKLEKKRKARAKQADAEYYQALGYES